MSKVLRECRIFRQRRRCPLYLADKRIKCKPYLLLMQIPRIRPKFWLASFCGLLSAASLNAQLSSQDCELNLDEAKKRYKMGVLEDVETKIGDCLSNNVFRERKLRIDGYRLLTESYLFRNDGKRATTAFENLLRVDPLFDVDSTDKTASFDLIYLSRTYQRKPLVSVYGSLGTNYSRLDILQEYATDNSLMPRTDYRQFVLGFNGGIGVEVPLPYDLEVALEFNYSQRTYRYSDSIMVSNNLLNPSQSEANVGTAGSPLLLANLSFKENQNYLDIPLIVRYTREWRKFIPYVYVGGASNILLSANFNGIRRSTVQEAQSGGQTVGSENEVIRITTKGEPSLRSPFNWSLLAGAGTKIRVGSDFVFLDVRYNRFLLNSVNRENRYSNSELIYRYAYVDSDFRIDNLAFNVGFIKSFYKPRKKRKYNPTLIEKRFQRMIQKEKKNLERQTDADAKREMNSLLNDMQRDFPDRMNDVRQGRAGNEVYKDAKDQIKDAKNQ